MIAGLLIALLAVLVVGVAVPLWLLVIVQFERLTNELPVEDEDIRPRPAWDH